MLIKVKRAEFDPDRGYRKYDWIILNTNMIRAVFEFHAYIKNNGKFDVSKPIVCCAVRMVHTDNEDFHKVIHLQHSIDELYELVK